MTGALASHCHIEDSSGALVFSNLPPPCRACLRSWTSEESEVTTACGERGKHRRGVLTTTQGSVYLCTSDADALKSSRLFKRELAFFESMLRKIVEMREDLAKQETAKARRLIHNLISLNAHSLQDLYSVVSQEDLASFPRLHFKSQKELIRDRLKQNPDAAAALFIRTLRNEGALKNELSVFKRLYDGGVAPLKLSMHVIHKVIFNVGNYFFQDFADNRISTRIEDCDERVALDYESVQVALYHILDNATKYCAPNTHLRIHFSSSATSFCILFDMTSYYVKEEERKLVYQEGYSGSLPRAAGKAGQGLGMGLVRDLLKLNNAELDANWGSPLKNPPGPTYAQNTIVIRFRR